GWQAIHFSFIRVQDSPDAATPSGESTPPRHLTRALERRQEPITMVRKRRDLLRLEAATLAMAAGRRRLLFAADQGVPAAAEAHIERVVAEYSEQGNHRTGTSVDESSGDWLCRQVSAAGLVPAREPFELNRVDLQTNFVAAGDRRIDAMPVFDGGFTDPRGITGRPGALASDRAIAIAECAPNTAGAGALGEARRANRHAAIVCVTRGGRPGLCPSNADSFLAPYGPPVLQVSSEHGAWLNEQAERAGDIRVVAQVTRTRVTAFNVTAQIEGRDPSLRPLVVSTPRSGWYSCASERGGGIACWLEVMRALGETRPLHTTVFVAFS